MRYSDDSEEEESGSGAKKGPNWQEMLAEYERKYPLEGLYADEEERDRYVSQPIKSPFLASTQDAVYFK